MVDSRKRPGKKTARRVGRRPITPRRAGALALAAALGGLVLFNCYVFLWNDGTSIPAVMEKAHALEEAPGPAAAPPPVEVAAEIDPEIGEIAAPATTKVTGAVARNDTLGKVLKKSGLSANETDEVLRALAEVFDFKSLQVGQAFTIERAGDGQVIAFELVVSKLKTVRVQRGPDGKLTGVADKAQTRMETHEVGGRIDSSLYASVKAAGEKAELVSFFVDVFAYDLDFYVDTHPGDTFKVVVEREMLGDEVLRYNRIVAAEYSGKEGTFRAFYWKPPGTKVGRYFDEKGRSVEKSLLKTPLKFARISSKFNPRRMHPVLHRVKGHFGVDYAAPTGTPVWAAASGTITTRAYSGGAGNLVVIKHDNGLVTKYMHLSKFASGQKVGQRVEAKTVIGFVGTTGLSTGPHLHFGVLQNGQHVDPLKLAPTRGRGVSNKEMGAFRAHVDAVMGQLSGVSTEPKVAGVTDASITDVPVVDDAP